MRWSWLAACILLLCAGAARAQEPAGTLTILLSSPGEAETFYSAPFGYRLNMPIAGQVVSYDAPLHPETIQVTVEMVDAGGNQSEVTVPLDDEGHFLVRASMLSSNRPLPSDDPHVVDVCGDCHNAAVELVLPEDVSHLVVSARSTDGRTGQVVRSLQFDYGSFRQLPVKVDGLPAVNVGAQVSATTLIYNWRLRSFVGTVVDGQAAISVEGLNHAALTYDVSLAPVIINETLYSTPPQVVVVKGGQETLPQITLIAEPTRGSLSGKVVDGISGGGIQANVLAVDLKTGAAQTLTADDSGLFAFDDLPVAEHLVLARSPVGFHLPQRVNLPESPTAETTIHLTRAGTSVLRGSIVLDGQPLPFAQVTTPGLPTAHADPITGRFELDAVDETGAIPIEIAAAGCYGAEQTTSERDLGEITLSLRPDTQVVRQGSSRLYIPKSATVTQRGTAYGLQSGVLWANGGQASDPDAFVVEVGAFTLAGANADFAVEKIGASWPRVYVSRGEVLVTKAGGESLAVAAGQTMMLGGDVTAPVELVPGAGAVLRAHAGSAARFELPPSPAKQQSATVSRIAVSAAQVLMLLALLISFVGLPAVLLGTIVVYFARRRTPDRAGPK